MSAGRPTLAVWKFASCDGCQLALLDCEDELLSIVGAIDIAVRLGHADRLREPEADRQGHIIGTLVKLARPGE